MASCAPIVETRTRGDVDSIDLRRAVDVCGIKEIKKILQTHNTPCSSLES